MSLKPGAQVRLDPFRGEADTHSEKGTPEVAFSRQIVSVVAAVLLAMHVVVGCCAHHAHAKPHAADGASQASDACHRGHRCAHDSADSSEPAKDGPCDHSCGQGSCTFVVGSRIVLPELSQPAVAVAASDKLQLSPLAPANFGGDHLCERPILPHLRSHLSKCVLVV